MPLPPHVTHRISITGSCLEPSRCLHTYSGATTPSAAVSQSPQRVGDLFPTHPLSKWDPIAKLTARVAHGGTEHPTAATASLNKVKLIQSLWPRRQKFSEPVNDRPSRQKKLGTKNSGKSTLGGTRGIGLVRTNVRGPSQRHTVERPAAFSNRNRVRHSTLQGNANLLRRRASPSPPTLSSWRMNPCG